MKSILKMKIGRGIPRLLRYAILNSIISFFIALIGEYFILPSDLGAEGGSIATVIFLAFFTFVSLGNLTYLLIPIKRIPLINLLFAFSWFSLLSFVWIYFIVPDADFVNDRSIKYLFLFYTAVNSVVGICTAFWYHRVIINILGPDPKAALFSIPFFKKSAASGKNKPGSLSEGTKDSELDPTGLKVTEEEE